VAGLLMFAGKADRLNANHYNPTRRAAVLAPVPAPTGLPITTGVMQLPQEQVAGTMFAIVPSAAFRVDF
jgi:hypothetical protein